MVETITRDILYHNPRFKPWAIETKFSIQPFQRFTCFKKSKRLGNIKNG